VVYERASCREAAQAGFGKNMVSGPRVHKTRKKNPSGLDSRKYSVRFITDAHCVTEINKQRQ